MTESQYRSMQIRPFRSEEKAKEKGTAVRYSYGWLALDGEVWLDSLGPLRDWKPSAEDVLPVKGKA